MVGINNEKKSPDFMGVSGMDVEFLKSAVGKSFPFYDVRFGPETVAFYVEVDEFNLEERFDSLRRLIRDDGYIPLLRFEGGEHIVYVIRRKKRKSAPVSLNVVLLALAVVTCTLTGSLLYLNEFDIWSVENIWVVLDPGNLFWGFVLFALPLLSILFIHEMGHYLISKFHGLDTSLPFFIPVPPIIPGFNIGTFGALISSHDPMPDRKTLFDVGVAGPLAGFAVAVPVTAIGVWLSEVTPMVAGSGEPILGTSLLFWALVNVFHTVPVGFGLELSPVAFAGWVGLLITSINLLPAGQLDGGHVFRAVLGAKQRWASFAAVLVMVLTGWFAFAVLVLFMGLVHPPPLNDASPLDLKRKLLFVVTVLVLIACFVPVPFSML